MHFWKFKWIQNKTYKNSPIVVTLDSVMALYELIVFKRASVRKRERNWSKRKILRIWILKLTEQNEISNFSDCVFTYIPLRGDFSSLLYKNVILVWQMQEPTTSPSGPFSF